MYHPVISVRDKRFSIYKIELYCLVISIGQDRLRISCIDRLTNRCLLLEAYRIEVASPSDYLSTLQQFFKEHAFIATSSWQLVTLCFENQHYTLVPAFLFQKKSTADYLQLAADVGQGKMMHVIHHDLGLAIPFAVDDQIEHWLRSEYVKEKCYTVHQASALIGGAVAYVKNKKLRTLTNVFVWVESAHLHITVVEKDKLLYYNRFSYGSSDDLLQYILVVMYTLALDPALHPVIILGGVTKNSLTHKKMRNYIRHISFSEKPSYLKCGWSFPKELVSHYFDILNFYPALNYLGNIQLG